MTGDKPYGLTAERLNNPIGIDMPRPGLSWKAPKGIARQSAYEIETDGLARGRTEGDEQIDVPWPGEPPATGSRHSWRVRLWDEAGHVTAWSAPATFVAGVMRPDDWGGAVWIGPNVATRPDIDFGGARWMAAPDGKYVATLYLKRVPTSLELIFLSRTRYEIVVNGQRSRWSYTGHVFDTKHPRIADLTPELRPGRNTVELSAPQDDETGTPSAVIAFFREDFSRIFLRTSEEGWETAESDCMSLGALRDVPWGRDCDAREELASPAFRKRFTVRGAVARATLFITGLGYYEAWLDGERVGDRLLDPSPTDYRKRVLYATHILDGKMAKGEHELRVLLGHGFYDGRVRDTWNFDLAPWRGFPRMIARLALEYADGTFEDVVTDGTWRQIKSPVGWDDIHEGEVIGGGHVREPAFPPDGFPVEVVAGPGGKLVGAAHPPTRVQRVNAPVSIHPVTGDPGACLVEFPSNVSGWARIVMRGLRRGDVVSIRYDERVGKGPSPAVDSDNGIVDTEVAESGAEPRRIDCHFMGLASQAVCRRDAAFQTDRFVSSGAPEEIYEPRFTYNGFRHLYVRGLRQPLREEDVEQRFISTDFQETGEFESSSPLLDRLIAAAAHTYRCNFTQGFPTDCPHREKNGWTDDASIACAFGMIRFDNAPAYRKWVRDIVEAQDPSGDLPGIAPTSGWGFSWGNGPVSDIALARIPWNLYRYCGDRDALETAYPALMRLVAFTAARADEDGLVAHGLGDWVPADPFAAPSVRFVASCHFLEETQTLARMADVLGRAEEAVAWTMHAKTIRDALRRVFKCGDVRFDNGHQTAQACAIEFGLVEPDEFTEAGARLVEAVHEAGDRLETGIVGHRTLYRALTRIGRADLALKVLLRPEPPSPAAWLRDGGDTLWEDWGEGASRNHIMFGDFAAWAVEGLAGIRPTAPGYRRFKIAPAYECGLERVRAAVESPYGRIEVEWSAGVNLRVTVPPCTEADVVLDSNQCRHLLPGRHLLERRDIGVHQDDMV